MILYHTSTVEIRRPDFCIRVRVSILESDFI